MKTPIEQLIEELKANDVAHGMFWIKRPSDFFEKYLEKEKEQMLDFGLYVKKNGWVGCKIEDLYEDYNNQNK